MITSLQNKRIKEALKLRRRRGRDEQSRFLIDGVREIQQALAASVEVVEAFVCESLLDAGAQSIAAELANHTENITHVNEPVWEKVSYGNRSDGVLVVARREPQQLSALNLEGAGQESAGQESAGQESAGQQSNGPILVLDRVEKPGNFGAICRTATAAGAAALIATDPQTDLFNPNAIRASLGTLFHIRLATATSAEALAWLRARDLPVFVTRVDATKSLFDVDLATPCAIVLGSEADGVSATWLDPSIDGIVLPMMGPIDSLNVANTASVVLYESLRQRSM